MNRKRLYVGINYDLRQIFYSSITPTERTHGDMSNRIPYYKYAVGPFRTRLAAEIFLKHGSNNPHMQVVADVERIAKKGRERLRKEGFDV